MDSEQVLGGEPQLVGSFRSSWTGSGGNGPLPSTRCTATNPARWRRPTELLLSHKHPDHPRVALVLVLDLDLDLDLMINDAEPFNSKHRIIDTTGTIHQVVSSATACTTTPVK